MRKFRRTRCQEFYSMEPADVLIAPPLMNPISDLITTPNVTKEVKPALACPWGKIKTVEAVSLNDVMSEQLISSFVEKEKIIPDHPSVYVDDFFSCGEEVIDCNEEVIDCGEKVIDCGEEVIDCSDDLLLAKMLQLEFDKEHDEMLRREESKYNGESKVKVTFGKFRRLPAECLSSDEDEDKEYVLEQNEKCHWRAFEQAEKDFHAVGRSGVSRQGNVTTTKHDLNIWSRRNAGRLMELSDIHTGDCGKFDTKLSNNVYSTLKRHAKAECKRRYRFHEKKEKSTTEKALDEKTQIILFKMVNNQTLDSLTGCISTGKEACVYHALSYPEEESTIPVEYAIKIFKTSLNEFKQRDQYIRDDYRFKNRLTKQNPQKVIHIWAEKEMRNLQRMKEANIPCPEMIALKKHVLVMSFIGKDSLPAPKIKDVELPFEDMTIMFEQTVE
ncbi:hypothetical protein TNCV_2310591, partial [Trichonephila clavipes]